MPEIDPVILQLRADVAKYRVDVENVTRRVSTQLDSQGKAVVRLENQISASTGAIASSFRSMAGALAAGFSAREVANMADSYTRFTNQLRVAGLEGENLASIQQRLFGVAQQNGVELEAVGTLYSRAAQNQRELGASTEDLIGLTRAVAASLRISGTSTNEASGALMQLGQALGSPRIQAEEFNSLLDTMQPLLREASKYIDGTGNSLAGLTRLIKDQNGAGVSNVQLFQALTQAMAALEKQAATTNLTISGAFTNLSNAVTKYIGEADQANGASAAVTAGLNALANNLDTVTEALAVLAAIMVGRFAAGMLAGAASTGAASTALFALQARAAGAATTMEALAFTGAATGRSLLAAFGGPVGLGVTALTLGIGYLASSEADANAAAQSLTASIQQQAEQFGNLNQQQAATNAATNNLTAEQRAALTATASLTGEANLLADAWGRVAAQAKAAAIEQARASLSEAGRNRRLAEQAVAVRAEQERSRPSNQSAGGPVGAIGRVVRAGVNLLSPGAQQQQLQQERQERSNLALALQNEAAARAELNTVQAQGLTNFRATGAAPAPPGATPSTSGAGGSGTARSTPAIDVGAIARRFQDDIERGQLEIDQAQADAIGTTEARRDVEANRIDFERRSNARAIEADGDLSRAQRDNLLALNESVAAAQRQAINAEALAEAKEQQLEAQRRQTEAERNNDQYEQAALDAQARIAINRQERNEIERRILASMEREEAAQLEAEIAAGRIADAQQARADLATAQAARRIYAEQQAESPLDRRRREVRQTAANMGDAVEDIELEALDRLTDGLADASVEFLKLGGVAGDVLNSIINDFIRLAAQQAIFGSAGSGGGLLGSIGGLLGIGGGPASLLAGTPYDGARATGGPVTAGKTYLVGERGPELFRADSAGTIVPNNELVGAAARSMVGASVASSMNQQTGTIRVVITHDNDMFTARVQEASVPVAIEVVRQSAPGIAATAKAETIRDLGRPRM